jgi:serine/threonine protein kinase
MFVILIAVSIVPTLLTQPTISFAAFWRTFFIMLPWVAIGHILFLVSAVVEDGERLAPVLLYVSTICLPPLLLGAGLLTGHIRSRMHAKSDLYRSAVVFMMGEAVMNLSINLTHFFSIRLHPGGQTRKERHEDVGHWVVVCLVLVHFIYSSLAPLMVYRTMRGDTKYWRGIGKHNESGMGMEVAGVRNNAHDSARMDVTVAAFSLQRMVEEFKRITIDFVHLEFVRKVGEGATAWVYESKYKGQTCATKVCTPLEYTNDELNEFATEVSIMKMMSHPNIVQFYGICLRPPQMASVMEYCVRGDLYHSLKNKRDLWTDGRKIGAMLGCCRAVAYLHNVGIMHRDIKPENFLVDAAFVVKLADFGESSHKLGNDLRGKTGVVGSPTYMAPELIANHEYTNSVDIYALAITFWEIWTGKEPFEGLRMFKLFDAVRGGERPPLDEDGFPPFIRELIRMAWVDDHMMRPTAADMLLSMEKSAEDFFASIDDGEVVDVLQRAREDAMRASISSDSSGGSELADYVSDLKAYAGSKHSRKHHDAGTDATVRMNLFDDDDDDGDGGLSGRGVLARGISLARLSFSRPAPSGKSVARRRLGSHHDKELVMSSKRNPSYDTDLEHGKNQDDNDSGEVVNPIRSSRNSDDENDDVL